MATKGGSDAVIGCFVLVAVAAVLYSGYHGMDSVGWIPHREDSAITAEASWFVGEIKGCLSAPLDAQNAKTASKPVGSVVYRIECDAGPERRVRITFYGKTEQPEVAAAYWDCTRTVESFVCRQTGAEPVTKMQQQSSNPNTDQPSVDWRNLCNNPEHTMTESEVREYARRRGISANDAGTEVGQAGCGIVADH